MAVNNDVEGFRTAQVADATTLKKVLLDQEIEILERQICNSSPKLSPLRLLFSCATAADVILLLISAVAATIGGALNPMTTVLLGNLAQTFQGYFLGRVPVSHFSSEVARFTLFYVYLAIAEFVAIYVATVGFMMTGERITQKLREKYLMAILRQNMAFFDTLGAGEITTRITSDTNLIQDAISGKLALTLSAVATFGAAFIVSFVKSWRLALVLSSAIVAIVGSMSIGATFMVKYAKQSLVASGCGATVAEEAISSARHVTAFGIQEKLARKYTSHLIKAQKSGLKSRISLAFMIAVMNCIIFWTYGLAFWQGSRFLQAGDINLASIITILLATLNGAFSLGNVSPHAQAFTTGIAAASKISRTISRVSPLDPSSEAGATLPEVKGSIEMKNVRHIYPSRQDVTVLDNVSLQFPAGKTTAVVGPSGCGKSTIVGLIERFYEPISGSITLDGHDLTTLNLKWLRQQISIVSQEPILFSTTVFENIRYGLMGTKNENESIEVITELVHDAAKKANAYDFIVNLPSGFQTSVGERGSLLSGGQKQRVAIARAIISDPKILLLDEATSALDVKAERIVQAALEVASKGRTTIVIAHRLSTITSAANIVVMSKGGVVEQGNHNELLAKKSVYYELVEKQRISAEASLAADVVMEEKEEDTLTRNEEKIVLSLDILSLDGTAKKQNNIDKIPDSGAHKYSMWTLIKFVASLNQKEIWIMIFGLFWSIIAGGGNPTQAVFFAKNISAMSLNITMFDKMRKEVNFWSLMYFMLGFTAFLGWLGQGLCFAYCSEKLIFRARDQAFRAILHQDIAMFDRAEFSSGALTSSLSSGATQLAGMSGVTFGTILIISTTLIAGVVLSTVIGWKLALVCTSTIPIVLICGLLRLKMLALLESRSKKAYEASATYACEASSAIKTVASLTLEQHVWSHYHNILEQQRSQSLLSVLKSSLLYAASQSFNFLCAALAFWYGGTLIANEHYSMLQFFICYSGVIAGAYSAGAIFSFAPDMSKASQAANDMKTLFDHPINIDSRREDGEKLEVMKGSIELRNLSFRYPNRPEKLVLNNLNLTISPGQYIALVGASGCGKSTIIAMLERFFDPESGQILVDGKNISTLNIKNYRSHLALVSQEPTLYEGTIRDNIVLGTDDDDVSEEAIIQACKNANIYDFILSLPDGFSTVTGARGGMLSGGQKQRIAIARALLRDPRILLLDEATSALDSESEKVVQAALDAAAKGRTTVAVAHRISTVQNADCIYGNLVLDAGRIIEKGTHTELMDLQGRYFELVKLQSLEKTE
ncbi:P-loop containing nucleoside triphosphate hydrolase protein [Tricladium varicosporioides]|nr:P-loop containing nucleoside triphosphate hydrolase protein [Hymenoscyphus varicosporioides]